MAMDWTEGLQHKGNYYEGWVEDIDGLLSSHAKATVTGYGTRRSSKASGNVATTDKENVSIQQIRGRGGGGVR